MAAFRSSREHANEDVREIYRTWTFRMIHYLLRYIRNHPDAKDLYSWLVDYLDEICPKSVAELLEVRVFLRLSLLVSRRALFLQVH